MPETLPAFARYQSVRLLPAGEVLIVSDSFQIQTSLLAAFVFIRFNIELHRWQHSFFIRFNIEPPRRQHSFLIRF